MLKDENTIKRRNAHRRGRCLRGVIRKGCDKAIHLLFTLRPLCQIPIVPSHVQNEKYAHYCSGNKPARLPPPQWDFRYKTGAEIKQGNGKPEVTKVIVFPA